MKIEVRGKDIKNGTWYYGTYYEIPAPRQCFKSKDDKEEDLPECNIVFEDPRYVIDWNMSIPMVRGVVDPHTVGLHTNCKDKNNNKIYYGDICTYYELTGIVTFKEGAFCITDGKHTAWFMSSDWREIEKVGNVYDNEEYLYLKELLK